MKIAPTEGGFTPKAEYQNYSTNVATKRKRRVFVQDSFVKKMNAPMMRLRTLVQNAFKAVLSSLDNAL